MEFLIKVVIFVVIMHVVMYVINKLVPVPTYNDKKKECPPHVWDYDETGFLICMTCKIRPGYSGRE